MKKETFLEVINGIKISNDALESLLNDIESGRLTEEQCLALTNELDKLNDFIKVLKPRVLWELWEADCVHYKLLRELDISPVVGINNARVIAKHFAKAWCINEEPHQWNYGGEYFWNGNSDFGVVIRKVKENTEIIENTKRV